MANQPKPGEPDDRLKPCPKCAAVGAPSYFVWRRKPNGPYGVPTWDLIHWHDPRADKMVPSMAPDQDPVPWGGGETYYGHRDNQSDLIKIWNKKHTPASKTARLGARVFDGLFEIFALIAILFIVYDTLTSNERPIGCRYPEILSAPYYKLCDD